MPNRRPDRSSWPVGLILVDSELVVAGVGTETSSDIGVTSSIAGILSSSEADSEFSDCCMLLSTSTDGTINSSCILMLQIIIKISIISMRIRYIMTFFISIGCSIL